MLTKNEIINFYLSCVKGAKYEDTDSKTVSELIAMLSKERKKDNIKTMQNSNDDQAWREMRLNAQQHKDLQITKTAIIKSLMEGGQIGEHSNEATKQLIEPWIKYIYRNSPEDFKLLNQ
jgi:hypothetical protein